VLIEHLDQPGKIHQRAGQPVDFVDHHHVNLAGLDVATEPFQRGPLQRAAREPAVVVSVGDEDPALGALARDIGFAGFPLCFEGVKLHLEAFFARLAGIDRAAEFLWRGDCGGLFAGHAAPRWLFSPKNTQPFQRTLVISRAIADSDLYGRP
jgi:hypothetical protein